MKAKVLWAGRNKNRGSAVLLYNGDPRQTHGWSVKFGFTLEEWREIGGVPLRAGECKPVRITVEEVRSDGE